MEVALESNAFFMGIEYLAIFCCGLMGGIVRGPQELRPVRHAHHRVANRS